MSLTVQQLNADSSFLLTFRPSFAPKNFKGKFPGTISILIDPWLSGASSVFHPKFATTYHNETSAIRSLKELKEEVDVVVISQDKPDHCHQETLCSLNKSTKARIFATPKAAFKIREWKHFDDPNIVEEIPTYSASKADSGFIRIPIAPYSTFSAAGEITITNITTRGDLTRLHNAIGITYRPPGTVFTTVDGNEVRLSDLPMASRPGTSSQSCKTIRKKPSISIMMGASVHSASSSGSTTPTLGTVEARRSPITNYDQRSDPWTNQPNFESVLSVLYTPHGIDPANLRPYIDNHLARLPGALPVTALFHALNIEANPKILGGLISGGAPGGIEIAKMVDIKHWISAHDEIKKNEGFATRFMSSKIYGVEEVTKMLRELGGITDTQGKSTFVESLGNGGVKTFRGG